MKQPVHVWCSGTAAHEFPPTWAGFATLRIGFPEAPIHVWGNGLTGDTMAALATAARELGATFQNVPLTTRDEFLEGLVREAVGPVWFVEPCVRFERAMPTPEASQLCRGRRVPARMDRATYLNHAEHLHPALLWLNAPALRGAMLRWSHENLPEAMLTAQLNFLRQTIVPGSPRATYYEAGALLYAAGLARSFHPTEDLAFEILTQGTV